MQDKSAHVYWEQGEDEDKERVDSFLFALHGQLK